jgi:hypothetical protein
MLLVLIILTSCSPSGSQTSNPVANAKSAQIPLTPTVISSNTPSPTDRPVPTPPNTVTPHPTPDERVIDADPGSMLLALDDLPEDGQFNIFDMINYRNEYLIQTRSGEEWKKRIERQGRIDGWIVVFDRGTRDARVPESFSTRVILYKTILGPMYSLDERGGPCIHSHYEYTLIDDELGIGDRSFLCLSIIEHPSGKDRLDYWIPIHYRNVLVDLHASGFEDSFDADWVKNIASLQIEKISSLPLSEVVTFQP